MSPPDFPFQRGVEAELGALRDAFRRVSAFRQANQGFSQQLLETRPPWKAWNEELVPMMLLADGLGLPDTDRFSLMPGGHASDLALISGGRRRGVQVTVADPAWSGAELGPGHLHALKTEHLAGGHVWGGALVRRDGGRVVSEPHARNLEDDIRGCKAGLGAALARKSTHDGRGEILLILAREFTHMLYDVDVSALIAEAVADAPPTTFDEVYVVDSGLFWPAAI